MQTSPWMQTRLDADPRNGCRSPWMQTPRGRPHCKHYLAPNFVCGRLQVAHGLFLGETCKLQRNTHWQENLVSFKLVSFYKCLFLFSFRKLLYMWCHQSRRKRMVSRATLLFSIHLWWSHPPFMYNWWQPRSSLVLHSSKWISRESVGNLCHVKL